MKLLLLLLIGLLFNIAPRGTAQDAALPEYVLKAEWLKQLARNMRVAASEPGGGAVCRVLVIGRGKGIQQMRERLELAETAAVARALQVTFSAVCHVLAMGHVKGIQQMRERLDQAETGAGMRALQVTYKEKATAQDLEGFHVVFVSNEVDGRVADGLFKALDAKPVLTIGDRSAWTKKGSVMGMAVDEGAIRLNLSRANASRAKVTLDPAFLEAAKKVITYE